MDVIKNLTALVLLLVSLPALPQSLGEDLGAVRQLLRNSEIAFNRGNLELGMRVFADDAIIIAPDEPLIEGSAAIEQAYAELMETFDLDVDMESDEFVHAGDYIYERGTYTLELLDKESGEVVDTVHNNHIHIFKRQSDGQWKTWRLMTNPANADEAA